MKAFSTSVVLLNALPRQAAALIFAPKSIANRRPSLATDAANNGFRMSLVEEEDADTDSDTKTQEKSSTVLFHEFSDFLQTKQLEIVNALEEMDGSGAAFTNDTWGVFADKEEGGRSGGITRVIQGGDVIEKGACSFTMIQQGVLSKERAGAIRARQQNQQDSDDEQDVQAGDTYSAAALSIVLHSRSPMVPTFRSDVRIFLVQSSSTCSMAWFGGGADLTPYYLHNDDIRDFHLIYKKLCDDAVEETNDETFAYEELKKACDDYFYLTARQEHRGTGGIFFDDVMATPSSMDFVKGVSDAWLPSWLPIVEKRRNEKYTDQQRHWQLLRRGRYLEFNLLYDRGVKFGLAHANPRVEGVMVSAPPLIAWEYNHVVEKGSPEEELMEVLKEPIDWIDM